MNPLADLILPKPATAKPPPAWRGEWFKISLMPDLAAGEVFNVGVAFRSTSGELHAKWLDDFSRLRCLYGDDIEEETRFLLALAANAAENGKDRPSPNIRYSDPQYATGESIEEILDSLFSMTVSLGRPHRQRYDRDDPAFSGLNTAKARASVIKNVQLKAGIHARNLIPELSMVTLMEQQGRRYSIDLPLRHERGIGTIVSACYKKRNSSEMQLHRAYADLDVGARHYQKPVGLFVLRPGESNGLTTAERDGMDDLLDRMLWKFRRDNLHIDVEEKTERLADRVLEWAGL